MKNRLKIKNKSLIQLIVAFVTVCVIGFSSLFGGIGIVFAGAGDVVSHEVQGLTVTQNGLDTNNSESSTGHIKAAVTGESGMCSDSASSGTLTLKNTKGTNAFLSFTYTVDINGGSIKFKTGNDAEINITSGGTYNTELSNNTSLVISLTSAKGAKTTYISLDSLALVVQKNVTITFEMPEGSGTYKVDGTTISSVTPITKVSTESYQLQATAGSNYKFHCWMIDEEEKYIGQNSVSLKFEDDHTISPVFIPSTTPVFEVSGTYYNDLSSAITYADGNSNRKMIVLVSDGIVGEGSYTIKNGKTLLIPFDDAHTSYTTKPEIVYGSHSNPEPFKTLTLDSGASITVANGGAISLPSKMSATGTGSGSWNGTPTGKYGKMIMKEGSSIALQSGSNLYCWGYIGGTKISGEYKCGEITANSGANMYEMFQIRCWRGGSDTSSMVLSPNAFPINQYFVQNIEVKLTIKKGAIDYIFSTANALSSAQPLSAPVAFITSGTSGGVFAIDSGEIVRTYNPIDDHVHYEIDGNVSISSFAITVYKSIDTADYQALPINYNLAIRIKSGATVTVSQDIEMLPGSKLIIDHGGTLAIGQGKSVYLYDLHQWGKYGAVGNFLVPSGYSTINGTTAISTHLPSNGKVHMVDAEMDINGIVTIGANGGIYTSSANSDEDLTTSLFGVTELTKGANVHCSQGGGKVIYNGSLGSKTSLIERKNTENVTINFEKVLLRNADNSTVQPSEGQKQYKYIEGVWNKQPISDDTGYTVTYVDESANVTLPVEITDPSSYSFPNQEAVGFSNARASLKYWIFGNEMYSPGTPFELTSNITVYAFYGGWVNKSSLSDSKYILYTQSSTIEYAEGLFDCETRENPNIVKKHLFRKNGNDYIFSPDGNEEIFNYSSSIYGQGKGDDQDYFVSSGIVLEGYGLKALTETEITHLYYIKEDGTIVKNATYYIPNNPNKLHNYYVNGRPVESGLYYFDSNGHMYYGNSLLGDNHEFGEINSGITQGGN
jgi:hypothetical protein